MSESELLAKAVKLIERKLDGDAFGASKHTTRPTNEEWEGIVRDYRLMEASKHDHANG